ncbi:hypothetical protein [Palleronia sp.]
MAKAHGGTLTAVSESGTISFTMKMPLVHTDRSAGEPQTAAKPSI